MQQYDVKELYIRKHTLCVYLKFGRTLLHIAKYSVVYVCYIKTKLLLEINHSYCIRQSNRGPILRPLKPMRFLPLISTGAVIVPEFGVIEYSDIGNCVS